MLLAEAHEGRVDGATRGPARPLGHDGQRDAKEEVDAEALESHDEERRHGRRRRREERRQVSVEGERSGEERGGDEDEGPRHLDQRDTQDEDRLGGVGDAAELGEGERVRRRGAVDQEASIGVLLQERDPAAEQDETDEDEDQETKRRGACVGLAPARDQEVHADGGAPHEEEEQQQIERDHGAQERREQDEVERGVRGHVPPGRDQETGGRDERGGEEPREVLPVDSHEVLAADGARIDGALDELVPPACPRVGSKSRAAPQASTATTQATASEARGARRASRSSAPATSPRRQSPAARSGRSSIHESR